MAWTPPSDAVVVQPTTDAPSEGWKPPSDAVAVKAEKWTPPTDALVAEAPSSGSPMGEDLGAAIMGEAASRKPKTFTGSVFDTEPFNPALSPEEATRLSRRAYAEQTMKPARRLPPSMTATPEEQLRPRTLSEANFDTWAGVLQGGSGFVKSILDNIPGEPGTAMLGGFEQGLEELKTPQLRSSQAQRQGAIETARKLQGEVAATRAAYQTMFTPAGADIVARGAGSIIPAVGMSLVGVSGRALWAANALANAGDAAVQASEQLKQISPQEWSKDPVYRSIRDTGLSHRDTVNMLAPVYALPAQAFGFATGAVSGATGLEKALTRGTERGLRAAVGRAGSEFLGEQVESLVPQFVGNLVASTIDPNITAMQGLGQTAVETAFGTLPGGALAALPSKRVNTLNSYAQSKGYADVQDMILKVAPTAGRKAVEEELIDALDREADEREVADQEAAAEREAIQAPPVEIKPLEGPEPPADTFKPPKDGVVTPVEAVEEKAPITAGTPAERVEAYNITKPEQTPMFKYITGINKTLDTFYNQLYTNNHDQLPDDLRTTRFMLDGVNDGMVYIQDRLANWDHPAITGATESDRRMGKARATAEERELLSAASNLSAIGTRLANQSMALYKGYKGKKAGSQAKIDAAEKELEKEFIRAIDLLDARGLLSEEESKEFRAMRAAAPKEAPVEPEVQVEDTLPPAQTEEPPQQVPVDKPAPITDIVTPEEPGDTTTPDPIEDKPYYGSEEINALGKRIKDAVEKIAADFMVGDMVRYGNIQGTVVGKDDTHVKIHPLGATSPKAYHRVPKARVEFISRPDTTTNASAMAMSGEDKKFGTEEAMLNMDKAGILKLLGANMYAKSAAEVAVKELLQNSFDAIKGAVSKVNGDGEKVKPLYDSGEITITFDDNNRTITFTDNGRGMTPDIVRGAFFTVAKSDKSDLPMHMRSGGKGVAKLGFLLGSESVKLDTVRDGVRVRVDATAEDIAGKTFQIVKTPAPKGEHGTTVTVKIPEKYVDPDTGEEKNIYFSSNPDFYDVLKKPLIGPVTVKTIKKATFDTKETTLPIGLNFPTDKYTELKVKFKWGDAIVYFGKERNNSKYKWDIPHQVLSAGVYQFDTEFKLGDEKIPYDIVINVQPNIGAQSADYPITNNREAFTPRTKEDIKSLNEYLGQIARGYEAADLQENFKNIVSMPRAELGADIAETTGKLQKSFDRKGTTERRELPPMPTEVRVEGTRVIATDSGKVIADRAKAEETANKTTFAAEKAAPKAEEFFMQMDQSPKLPIFHNNTNVDFLEVGRQYGEPERFFAELGTLMVEMKEILGDSGLYGYDKLKPENLFFGGVSIDKGYGGVHLRGVPYKAVFVNPFYDFGAKTLGGVRRFLMTTMVHELAHTNASGHDVAFNTQMVQVDQYLEDIGMYDYFADSLLDLLMQHESTFTAMREAYGRSTTKNTAKSLKDYEEGAASESIGGDTSGSENTLRAISAGRKSGGYGAIRAAGPVNPTSGIPRAAGSTSPDSVKGLNQDVVDAINRNDVNATLRAISRNTSGLYAELARRLAELNLPTSIVFNNERALVRQLIDDSSAQQQIRLFAYLSRVAPEVYEKYFKDYDKSENLERVNEGLTKLGGIDTNPVNTELAAVKEAYRKNITGLTAPGFFAPTMDAINIRPNPILGSDNRVVLHEIVHAATEFMLYGQLGNLTTEQLQAVADIYEMYDYAQSKLPPGDYGFTSISEFVAEIMTNPSFQNKLKAIPYKRENTSILNSFARFVANLFGFRNLTGAAMSAVNDILSPHRPSVVKAGPLRFATNPPKKRVRGPISKPDTWRTAEKVETTIKEEISNATKGRIPLGTALKDLTGALWSASGSGVRFLILPVLNLRQLKDLTRTKFPQLTGAVDIVEKMVAYRGQRIKVAEKIVQTWGPLQDKYPKQSSLMSRIMLESTIRARDPDAGVPAGGVPDALDNAYAALRPEFKQLYREVRDFFGTQVTEMVRTMKQRALGLPKAQRQEMIRKINDQFGPGKLVSPYFPLRRFGDNWFQIGKGPNKEFYTFSNSFSRNLSFNKRRRQLLAGNAQQKAAADTMRMGNGISELYSQNIATTQVLRDLEDTINSLTATDVAGIKSEIKDSLNQLVYMLLPQQSMRKMFINRRAVQGASSDMLRVFAQTSVRSAYQMARFKYAEPFVNNINNARDHIDSMESAHAITPQQGGVYRDYVLELEKRTKVILGVEDKSAIAQSVGAITGTTFFFMLSAPASALLNILGMAQLTMPYIGGRYGYAKTNVKMLKYMALYGLSLPERSLSPLVRGNFAQVSFPSIVESSVLASMDPIVQRAAKRFVDDGDINISMTNDIFDLSENPSALYTGYANTTKKLLAGVFHQAERLNREIALLTVFELAYDKFTKEPKRNIRGVVERDNAGKPVMNKPSEAFELALQEARDIGGLTLGDYTRQTKGRIFAEIPSLNVVAQFKQYAIGATYNILRNTYLSVGAPFRKAEIEQFRQEMIKDGLPPTVIDQRLDEAEQIRKETYREGMKRLAGILGMSFLFGGIAAQPFFSMLGQLIQMFAPDDDDEFFDWENWFYNYMENEVGGSAAAIFKKMGMDAEKSEKAGVALGEALARGPLATATGTSLADRVSLDLKNLWWREGRYSPDVRQSLQQDIIANIGPTVGLGLNWADAWQLAGEGQWGRAFEKAAPAMFSRAATAYRLGDEGATSSGGEVIGGLYPEQFTTWELGMQAIGLQPEKLAQAQKAAIQAKTYEQKILDRRNSLLDRLWMERGKPSYADALQKSNEFSLKYPEIAIDGDAVSNSFDARAEAKAQAEAIGAKLNGKMLGRTAPMLRYGMQ